MATTKPSVSNELIIVAYLLFDYSSIIAVTRSTRNEKERKHENRESRPGGGSRTVRGFPRNETSSENYIS